MPSSCLGEPRGGLRGRARRRGRSAPATTSAAPVARTASSSSPVEGRWPTDAGDHVRAGLGEELGQTRRRTRHDDAPRGRVLGPATRSAVRRACGDLLGEVGHPDPVRPAGADAGLDGGARRRRRGRGRSTGRRRRRRRASRRAAASARAQRRGSASSSASRRYITS